MIVSSSAYEASRVLKGVSGRLSKIIGYNSGPAQWIQVHNSATLPANGVAPLLTLAVPTLSNFNFDLGFSVGNGIVICNSTTGPTKTLGAADCYFTAIID